MFGLFEKKETPAPPSTGPQLPMGFRLGAAVAIDNLPFRLHADAYGFKPPAGDQFVEAVGKVDLGGGSHLHRFYLTDDAWVQVGTTGDTVDDAKLFAFAETKTPGSRSDFVAWVEEGSQLGNRELSFGGYTYLRVFGDEAAQWAPPIVYDESVTHTKSSDDFDLTHYSMLFQRELAFSAGKFEYLWVSAEDYSPTEFLVVFSVGVDITTADLTIT